MTTAAETAQASDHERGCCGRQLPRIEVVALGSTPGVVICVGWGLHLTREATTSRRSS